jgi:uncharacterized LabA/DUF88 family protein
MSRPSLPKQPQIWYILVETTNTVIPPRGSAPRVQSPLTAGFAFVGGGVDVTRPRPRTSVYIDGFNLYYGCFRGPARPGWSAYKWLDLERLCDLLLPRNAVAAVKYYTADVHNRPPDNHQADRQGAYLSALATLARVHIIKGRFLSKVVRMRECSAAGGPLGNVVSVLRTEEKGSDVNLAVDLLFDAMLGQYDCAVVVSNDSDLLAAIQKVRGHFQKPVGIINPHPSRPSAVLHQNADFHVRITRHALASCQLPEKVQAGGATIERPTSWR